MTISPLALAAKKVIDAAWLHGDAYDLSSQAAFALESAQLLQSPETAAEMAQLRARIAELEQQLAAKEQPADEAPIAYALTDKAQDVTPQVRKLRSLLAGQRVAVEGEHYPTVHHDYRTGRDLPQIGGI